MNLTKVVTITIVMTMMLIGGFTIMTGWGEVYKSYGSDLRVKEGTEFTAIKELNKIGLDIEDRVLKLSEKASTFNPLLIYDLAALFLSVGKYFIKIPNALGQSISQMTSVVRIPAEVEWFYTGVITLIGLLVIMKIAAIFLKRETV